MMPDTMSRRLALGAGVSFAFTASCRAAGLTTDDALLTRMLAVGDTPPPRTYHITNPLVLSTGQRVTLAPGTRIIQQRPNTPVLTATGAHELTIIGNGAELWGEGSWSPEWQGNSGHYDRGIHLLGCQQVLIDGIAVRNCAHAGIAIIGGSDVRIVRPQIEGTHNHGRPLSHEANFQMGIYLRHDPLYGAADAIAIEHADISGTAQGLLSELEVAAPLPRRGIAITDAHIHDIPGQHAFYLQAGATRVDRPLMERIGLAGVKIQGGDANAVVSDVTVTGAVARDLGSQMFEVIVAPPFVGKVRNISLEGRGTRVARAIAIGRRVEQLSARLVAADIGDTGVELNGEDLADIGITADLQNIGRDGVVVYAKRARDIRIEAVVRNPNTSRSRTACGVRVESPSADVSLIDPYIDDTAGRMQYGLFNSIEGSTVRIEGSARFTGAALQAIRATGRIVGLPRDAAISGKLGRIVGTVRMAASGR
jgi:hypothetical protein